MSYDLHANHEHRYVHLVYSGTIHIEERKQARDAAFAMLHECGFSRALVDMHDSNIELTTPGIMNFVRAFKEANLPPNYRLACVAKPHDTIEQLVETLLTIDGITIRYFQKQDEAINWLLAV